MLTSYQTSIWLLILIYRMWYRYRFEVKVCDDSGNEGTFVIFDKEALKLVVRQAPDVMNEMSEVRTIEKFNRAYVSV